MDQLNLSSEEKLLLYCSRLSISDDLKYKIDEIFSNELDWNFILECSARQGISPLFYWNLKNINHSKDVPPEAMKNLEKRYYNNLARNMLLYDELGKVLKAFKRVGIETIVLKGAFLAEEIYKNIGLRTMSDIDLLIKKEDLQRAKRELEKLMYSATIIFPTQLHEQLGWNDELPFIQQNKKIVIEIHRDIQPVHTPYEVDIDKFWNKAKSVKVAGVEVLTFAPEDTLQHLCLHVDKHINYAPPAKPLRDYCDIAEVTRHYKEIINWNYLVQSSKNFRAEKPIYQGLFIAKEYFDAFVPENILSELRIVEPKIVFEEIFKGSTKDDSYEKYQLGEIKYLMMLQLINGTWNKIRILFGSIFPSKEYMMYRYSIKNKKQIYKYYLIHLGMAFRWALATLWKLPHHLIKFAFERQ